MHGLWQAFPETTDIFRRVANQGIILVLIKICIVGGAADVSIPPTVTSKNQHAEIKHLIGSEECKKDKMRSIVQMKFKGTHQFDACMLLMVWAGLFIIINASGAQMATPVITGPGGCPAGPAIFPDPP